jgi:hypothetical protein
MMNITAWQTPRQRSALWLLLLTLGWHCRRKLLDLGRQGFQIGLEQKLLALAGISLACGGKFKPLELGHLVGQLVDEHLLEAHLCHESGGQLAQLLGVEVVQGWRGGHHGTTSCHSKNRFTTGLVSVG